MKPVQRHECHLPGQLGHHGNSILCVRIVNIAHMKPVQRHECDLPGQLGLVHLLKYVGSHSVTLHYMMEQSVPCCHLNSCVDTLLTLKVFNHQTIVRLRN